METIRLGARMRARQIRIKLGLVGVATLMATAGLVVSASAEAPKQALVEHEGWAALPRGSGVAAKPATQPHIGQAGSTIVPVGDGALVVERNAQIIASVDGTGKVRGSMPVGEQAGLLVTDGAGAVYLSDRSANRVVQVAVSSDGKTIDARREVALIEPYGLALTPDAKTLLVTSVADQALIAIDTETFQIRWRTKLVPEPRGVAVSPDGSVAAVGFLSTGSVALVQLPSGRDVSPRVDWISLDPSDVIDVEFEDSEWDGWATAEIRERRSRFQVPTDTGRRRARNVFAPTFVGDGRLIAPHELAASQLVRRPHLENEDNYGGAPTIPAIRHQVAFADVRQPRPDVVPRELDIHQPRATAYDANTDTLFIGGWGDSRVVAIRHASGESPQPMWAQRLGGQRGTDCAVDGMAVVGDRLMVHCNLWRQVVSMQIPTSGSTTRPELAQVGANAWTAGPEIAPSRRSELVEHGAWLFRRGRDRTMSEGGFMACESCHPEGRADGLSWRLGEHVLQTPYLAGRVEGTAPYKWSGTDRDLEASFRHTIGRLGGFPAGLNSKDYEALQAYLESLPPPTPPTVTDADAVERGQKLFESNELACDTCHLGPALADGGKHEVTTGAMAEVDTPSLRGLAHSGPYYHDGSAIDLTALVTDRGTVHGMADFSKLDPQQVRDLVAYLETL